MVQLYISNTSGGTKKKLRHKKKTNLFPLGPHAESLHRTVVLKILRRSILLTPLYRGIDSACETVCKGCKDA